jgi:hypothetical protein
MKQYFYTVFLIHRLRLGELGESHSALAFCLGIILETPYLITRYG